MTSQLVTVTGTYVLADDTPAAGTVLLTPVVVAGMSADVKRLVTMHSVMARLDGDGSFEVGVLASDDPDWMVSGPVLYQVAEYIAGARGKGYQVHIPGPGPVDLADLQPVDDPQTVAPYPVPGPVGPANSLTVGTVTTLPPGSDATATISGTPPAQVLDLGIPTGATGDPTSAALGDLTDVDTSRDATGMVITRQVDGTYKGQHVRVSLNQLTDATAPADTPPNSLLGTVGEGTTPGHAEWEPLGMDYVAGQVLAPHLAAPDPHPQYLSGTAVWPGKTRTSRPNATDRLVEVWDGTAWIPTHYDSGRRDINAMAVNPLGNCWLLRTGGMVTVHLGLVDAVAGEVVVTLPPGFRPQQDMYLPRLYFDQRAIAFETGEIRVYEGGQAWLHATFPAVPTIPTSLPGTLISTAP